MSKMSIEMSTEKIKRKIRNILNSAIRKIQKSTSIDELESLRIEYLGRKSQLSNILKGIGTLPQKERPEIGKIANATKLKISQIIEKKRQELQKRKTKEPIDLTLPGRVYYKGNLHPITAVYREMNKIMMSMGFSVYEGPHIESDFRNFELLNLPKEHPSRDLWDTIYIKSPEILLRCHNSSVEVHALLKEKPPIRIVVPGGCFRNEKPNVNNHFYFHQYEALAVGEGITMAHLKGVTELFFHELIGPDVILRFRCKHYPQVEPGVGIDIQCRICKGKGCIMCKYRKWVEIGGAGMVHVNTLKACGIDTDKYTGFAWGLGVDRIAMQKFRIKDIRQLYTGELFYS